MEKSVHKGSIVKREIPDFPAEKLALYAEEYHCPPEKRGAPLSERLDPPVSDIVMALREEVACIADTYDSCAGRAHKASFFPKAITLLEQMGMKTDATLELDEDMHEPEPDPLLGMAYDPDAYIELAYSGEASHSSQAVSLHEALISNVYEFGDGENSFRGRIEHIPHHSKMTYQLLFDKPPTEVMLECMWGLFREKIEPFKVK